MKLDNQLFRDAFNASPIGIAVETLDGKPLFVNPALCSMLGYSEEELCGKHCVQFSPPGDAEKDWALFEQLRAGSINHYQLEKRYLRRDGSLVWGRLSMSLINIPPSPLAIAMVEDITDKRMAEEKLLESEQRFRLVADTAPVLIWMSGPDKLCTYFNQTWLDFTGRSMEEELGNRWAERVHADDLQRCLDIYSQSFDRREKFRMEYRLRHHDGEYRWILDIGVPRFGQDGSFAGYIGTCFDLTEQKIAEEALVESEEKFSKAFRQSPMAVTLTSAKDHHYLDVNETFERLSGWRRDEVIGRTPFDISIWVDPAQRLEFAKRLIQGGVIRDFELNYRCKDGRQRVGLGSADLIEIGNELCILSVIADITDRKGAEEALSGMSRKLIQAQEQERSRIGRELHDNINQRLAMLSLELEQLPAIPSDVESRVHELRRYLAEISSEIQALSHDLHSSKLEYLGAVGGMKSWCREFAERHKLEIDFNGQVHSPVPSEIGLCLFRVLQGALQNVSKHSGVKRAEVELREESNEIQLVVSDLGRGFDLEAALQDKGLGLTSMRERIRLVNGMITLETKPMAGTKISVRVPRDSKQGLQRAM